MKKALCLSTAIICLSAALMSCSKAEAKTKKETSTPAATTAATTTAADTTAAEKSEADASAFAGKWQCSSLTIDGKKEDNLWGADAFSLFQIELKDDDSGTFLSFLFSDENKPENITWELKDDGSVIIKGKSEIFDEDAFKLTKNGSGLLLDLSDESSEFKADLEKVDEFKPIPDDMEMSFNFSTDDDSSSAASED